MNEQLVERPTIGGTDGHRGPYTQQMGPGLLNDETLIGLSAALVQQPEVEIQSGPVVIARDTRPSSESLQEAVAIGIQFGSAADIIDLGVNPTPMAQRVAMEVGARATVVVTASHNPAHENGWKGMIGHNKPNDAQVRAISDTYYRNLENPKFGLASELVSTASRQEWTDWYHDTVVEAISAEFGEGVLDGKLLVYDGARGAASELAPRILRSLGARQVVPFACDERGLINDGCGAADLSGLSAVLGRQPRLTASKDFIGALANDGDGDRVMAVAARKSGDTQTTEILDGNYFMWALAQGEPGIVGTLYTNGGLRMALEGAGIEFDECDNGDRYVTEALLRRQTAGEPWRRGGEFTGHLIDTTWLGSGDGLFNGAWYAADTVSRGMTFADRHEEIKLFPELMKNLVVGSLARAKAYLDTEKFQFHREIIERDIREAGGRTVIRTSGTEPKLRVWGEVNDRKLLHHTVDTLSRHILSQLEVA